MEKNFKNSISAGGIVVNIKGEILVVSQRGTSWSLPKGHIEIGEDALSAAKREVYEESGINQLEHVRDLGTYQRYKIGENGGDDLAEIKTMIMFLFTTNTDVLKPIDPLNPEARWVQKNEVADLLTHQKDKDFFLQHKDFI
jgi:8-oxo-dGTP diphosphatase